MKKIRNKFYELLMLNYIRKNPHQLKKINDFNGKVDTFLVISNTALGDTILSTPAIKSLKKSFPQSKIVVLMHKNYIPLFDNFKYIDTIVPFYGGYKKFLKTVKEIRKHKPQMCLIFHGNGPQDIQFAIMSGSNFILKHPTNSKYKKYLSYNFEKKSNRHIIEERIDLVRKIGGKEIDVTMEISPQNDNKLDNNYKQFYNYIGFQVGAADLYKMWPIENFIELGRLLTKSKEKIVITGTDKEYHLGEKIIKALPEKAAVNMCGKTSINELPYLMKQLKVLITNDTGTMHLAIVLKTPTISLFSPTDSSIYGPYQNLDLHLSIQKNGSFVNHLPKKKRGNEGMRLIGVSEVYDTTIKHIQRVV